MLWLALYIGQARVVQAREQARLHTRIQIEMRTRRDVYTLTCCSCSCWYMMMLLLLTMHHDGCFDAALRLELSRPLRCCSANRLLCPATPAG